jgi:hypothetical protein
MKRVKLEPVDFPDPHLDCYEASLMSILRYMGLPEETPLMGGAHAYFTLDEDNLSVWARLHSMQHEWQRMHGLKIETCAVTHETNLQEQLVDKLDNGIPVCFSVDIYFLPHTSHYRHLHVVHHLDVFGYDDDQYYVVSPYYRFQGWIDVNVLHSSIFSPANSHRRLIFVPELVWKPLSVGQVQALVRESCEYMLGLVIPEALANRDSRQLGLTGISSFAALLRALTTKQHEDLQTSLLVLSAQVMAIGYSRYWLQRLIQSCQPNLLSTRVMSDLSDLFSAIVSAWRAVGMRFGVTIHAHDCDAIETVACRIEELYGQEYQLFNTLLGALPDYDEGYL